MRRWLAKIIYYKLLGWQIKGNYKVIEKDIKKAVIILAPHTSWYDFYIGILLRTLTGIKTKFIGKKELFVFPFNLFFKFLGGSPIDRSKNSNVVEQIVDKFENESNFKLALSPEGTRKKVEKWRTGFYYIAKAAKVPIVMITLDFKNKTNKFSKPFYTTDNTEEDFKYIRGFFKDVQGRIPKYS